ncbi:hypothetical protein HPL003_21670 [Paenibacillus terrae HPL-003]|uniref:Phosphonate C-P lyase system protein PhnG n=1 Tax=Paenibacillus terrae (strain HPL-003) TaxID=985665 RepID=G7VPR4_PAETH|nr:phosphonate C-P lyase system protein PhnG [Paenibacillus terrae]AET61062.1 hypothetical protein HPL003_21670 [Paenibacillus terrae HPL-003]
MRTSQRTRILVEGDRDLLIQFATQVEERYPIRIEKPPMKSLAMSKARDLVTRHPFYLGEVLLTECTVSIENRYGFGTMIGEDLDKAYALAVVDAAYRARLPITSAWSDALLEEERRIERRHQEQLAASLRTKVDFATKEENTNDK